MKNNGEMVIRCPRCGKLLAKARGIGILEIKCHRCKKYNLYLLTKSKGSVSIPQSLVNKGDIRA
jgi:phage FluMu protein Com